ncbi:MAG: acyl-CoA dehydrogenase [Aquisalimonadaceae bacterium]
MVTLAWLVGLTAALLAVTYLRAGLLIGTAVIAGYLIIMTVAGQAHWLPTLLVWLVFLGVAIPLNVGSIRRQHISNPGLGWVRKVLPPMSDTEREAVEAGTVWWDGELFSGRPDWPALLAYPRPSLTEEERAFLDGPAEEVCRMATEWEITFERMDLPPEVWAYLREHGFFGMIIPRQYGGLGFSAYAHSQVAMKLASRSGDLGSTVIVPNSLGPAELLMHYGTDEQRNHYLPRLARGEDIPCFALTSPHAGSDAAGSMRDEGIVCMGQWNGEEVLGLRVSWNKRYITLAPVATLLGLAFKARDPNHLMGEEDDLGITLALIPAATPGVEIGRRHFPLNAAFMNGPTSGKDVFIPMEYLIGGQPMLGKGWMMLMNVLSVGRSISLPAAGTGTSKAAALFTGSYARVRRQFKLPIGEFEGIQEALARIGGNTYMADAARTLTTVAVDQGEKPSVISAIVKYHVTERMRGCVNDAMDVHGGKGICLGPNNYLGRAYQQAPISITVEGANILTRNMMIFGQGAIRCHPYLLSEMHLAEATSTRALEDAEDAFDKLLFQHVGYTVSNVSAALLLGLTGGRLAMRTPAGRETRRYYQQLSRLAAGFALLADTSMLVLGGSLKRRERLSARLGDVLSYLYLGSAVLKRFHDQGRPTEDLPLLEWSMEQCLLTIQNSIHEVLRNFPERRVAALLRVLIFPLGRGFNGPSDRTCAQVAQLMMEPGAARARLVEGVFISTDREDAGGALLYALERVVAAEPVEERIQKAIRSGKLAIDKDQPLGPAALEAGVIDQNDLDILDEAERARDKVIMVDDFAPTDVLPKRRTKK